MQVSFIFFSLPFLLVDSPVMPDPNLSVLIAVFFFSLLITKTQLFFSSLSDFFPSQKLLHPLNV
jgi:hypothetical protein